MNYFVIECEAKNLQHILNNHLKNCNIISIAPLVLQSQHGAFPTSLQTLIVSTYIITYAVEENEITST